MGSRHAENLHRLPGVGVVAVADPDAEAAGSLSTCTGAAICEAEELIAAPDVDAVVIASPDDTHARLTVACIEAGKPTLCEKPMATTVADARAVFDAEERAGRRLVQVGFMRVYEPAHVEVKAAIDAGEIGRPLHVQAVHLNPPWIPRTPEVVIVQSAIHDIHSVRWLLDAEIEQVLAHVVSGDDGSARLVQIQCWVTGARAATDPSRAVEIRRDMERRRVVHDHWLDSFDIAYRIEAEAWVDSLVAGVEPSGPGVWDGYVATCVADAAIRSVSSGAPEAVETGVTHE
jgi:myo-inositol 2-dehydrogenase/D-chiro-inositol 1-dehydrogenase